MKHNLPYDPSKIQSILVAISLTTTAAAGQAFLKLGDVPQLRDCVGLLKVEAFNATLMTIGPNGTTDINMPDAAYKVTFLKIFNSKNTEVRASIPLAKLIRSNGNSQIESLNIFGTPENPHPIDPGRTGIQIADLAQKGAGTVALLEFIYVAP